MVDQVARELVICSVGIAGEDLNGVRPLHRNELTITDYVRLFSGNSMTEN
jgi:hypothetical protein